MPILSDTTVLKIFNSFIVTDLAETYRFELKELSKIPQIKQPTFTFAHILLPHYPYIFDAQGNILRKVNPLNQFAYSHWQEKEKYVGHSAFIGRKVVRIRDAP